jgi:hypothetical protein
MFFMKVKTLPLAGEFPEDGTEGGAAKNAASTITTAEKISNATANKMAICLLVTIHTD